MLAERCRVADDLLSRSLGLLPRASLDAGEGLLLTRTTAIHMLGMRFAIDVVFVDPRWRVVDVALDLRPWVPLRFARGAATTLELSVGSIAASRTQVGDDLKIEDVA